MSTSASEIGQRQDVRVEQSAKRVRAYLGGVAVADTTRPLLVWERAAYPAYYIPAADVRMDLLEAEETGGEDGETYTLTAGGLTVSGAAVRYGKSPMAELRDAIRFDWHALDAWFEEDEEVFTHPRSPYTRIDVLPSSRQVRVELDGTVLAETSKPSLLFETGLPVRYYLPKTHVRMDLLTATETHTHCPYKGQAEYWSVRIGDRDHRDIAWSYPAPLPESIRVAGLVCFYNERVDLIVDGVAQERPSRLK